MKVWIVSPTYDYEGYGEPVAACSTKKKADEIKAELLKRRLGGDRIEITELVLDPKQAW